MTGDFRTTLWSEIARAQGHSRAALNRVLARYRAPVLEWLLGQGLQAEDAEDVTQAVFERVHRADLLQKADRSKGRFRWFILGIARNVLREHRRGRRADRPGGKRPVSLDAGPRQGVRLADLLDAPAPDREFDRIWVVHLVQAAVAAAQREEEAECVRCVEFLRLRNDEGLSYDALAQRFGLALHDVKNRLHRARKRVVAQVRRLIEEYSSSIDEYEEEVRFVSQLLGSRGRARGPEESAEA